MKVILIDSYGKKILIFFLSLIILLKFCYGSDKMKVKFLVNIPENTPDTVSVYISGNISQLGDWHPGKIKLIKNENNLYLYNTEIEEGQIIEYKYTLGDWAGVETDDNGMEINNRKLKIQKNNNVIKDKILKWKSFNKMNDTLTGDIRFHNDFYSPELNNKRTIIVYLPPNYEDSGRSYPVFYMHDGNNIFNAKTSFTQVEWEVDETAEELIKNKIIEPVIIVGIYNNSDRINEYTPYKDKNFGGGKGNLYLEFIINQVKPFIEKEYRISKGRNNTAIGGSSLGGLISLYAILKYQDLFSKSAVISPALYWDNSAIITETSETVFNKPVNIWLDGGTNEGVVKNGYNTFSKLVSECKKAEKILTEKKNVECKLKIYDGAGHHESYWAKRMHEILIYFYGK
jgi:predicted alpha/beta superfamily hydrolase